MQEFKNKSDYSVTVFCDKQFLVKMQYADDIHAVCRWLDKSTKYNHWTHINVYARRSGRFIGQFSKKHDVIPAKPKWL